MRLSKNIFQVLAVAAVVALGVSCSKNDGDNANYNSDKARLKTVIDSLTTVYTNSVEGNKPGQYSIGARSALDSVINLASQVYTGGTYTQEQVNNSLQNLLNAGQTFNSLLLQEVSVANLVAFWKFNGNPDDSSGHGHNGLLRSGYVGDNAMVAVDGGVVPVLVPDRFGRTNMAYEFNNAAHVEVPYDGALNPQSITITAWVKRYTTNSNNYMVSLNRYNGYKLQLQSNNFLFFTFKDSNNGYHDVDDNPGAVPLQEWTHIALTYTNGAMKFYINGAIAKSAAVSGSLITLANPVSLSIGNELPKSVYNITDNSSPYYYYGPGYFMGALDDIRLYNVALSAAEVLSIYTQESSL